MLSPMLQPIRDHGPSPHLTLALPHHYLALTLNLSSGVPLLTSHRATSPAPSAPPFRDRLILTLFDTLTLPQTSLCHATQEALGLL